MTLFHGLLEPATGRLDFICAAHPFPLLRRAGGGIEELGRGSFPLGLWPTLELAVETVTLEPGDLLLLYTDGLPEAMGAGGDVFGFPRLRSLLAPGGSPQQVLERILQRFEEHRGAEPLRDDLTVVIVKREVTQ
jgi:sigma-B regulation protein RsbU (phosphoserine phosphatase)